MLKSICKNCGVEYSFYPSTPKKSCSKGCTSTLFKKEKWAKYKRECLECGKEYLPSRPGEASYFCSYKCRGLNCRAKRVDRGGYWYIYDPTHPNARGQGYVAEHRLVVEKSIGGILSKDIVIHHIDGNKKNNILGNLLTMPDSEHKSYHARKRNRGYHGQLD